jgi:hypothetical protein
MIRAKAKAFFTYYKKWINQIPVVVCENEWDNELYRDFSKTTVSDYVTELSIVVDEGHKAGFKVADAGITSNNLGRWVYSQMPLARSNGYGQRVIT